MSEPTISDSANPLDVLLLAGRYITLYDWQRASQRSEETAWHGGLLVDQPPKASELPRRKVGAMVKRFRDRLPLILVLLVFLASHVLVVADYGALHDPAHSSDTCIVCAWVKALAIAAIVVPTLLLTALVGRLSAPPRPCFLPISVGFAWHARSPPGCLGI